MTANFAVRRFQN